MFNVERAPAGIPLDVRELVKAYGERVALDGISFSLQEGEGLALLGPNGCGKTTLLSLCSGSVTPTSGSALVQGQDARHAAARRKLGFVPQQIALYEELTGEENALFFGRLAGLSGAKLLEGVRVALDAADLRQNRHQRASSYSGGMQRRLSVACALVHAPVLLLLDEPFVGIDAASKAKLCELLLERKRAGLALVLSTHDPAESRALCERTLILENGRQIEEGLPSTGKAARVRSGKTSVLRPIRGERA